MERWGHGKYFQAHGNPLKPQAPILISLFQKGEATSGIQQWLCCPFWIPDATSSVWNDGENDFAGLG
jgi:hypothetical protein